MLLVAGHLACKKTEWWGAGVVICLQQGADLYISRLVLPFWYWLTRVVLDKGALNGCGCVYCRTSKCTFNDDDEIPLSRLS